MWPPGSAAVLTGPALFPGLMAGPFKHGLVFAFSFSVLLYLVVAAASWRGGSHRAPEADPARRPGATLAEQPAQSCS